MNQFQSLDEVLNALRRRASLMVLLFLAGCLLSLYIAVNQVHLYRATAVVQIERPAVPDQLAGASAQGVDTALRLRLVEQRLMARDNVLALIDEFDLFEDTPNLSIDQQIFMVRQSARVEQIVNSAQAWQPGNAPSGLYITVTLADPEKAAAVANALMQDVIEQSRERSLNAARETAALFEAEEARVLAEIASLETRIAEFKQANAASLPTAVTSASEQVVTLRESELDIDREIIALQGGSSRLRENDLARQIELLRDQKALIQRRIAELEVALADAPSVERELSGLERELANLQERFTVIGRRKAEAELGQVLQDRQQAERYEVLESALVPENPVTRSRKVLALLGAAVSFMAAVGTGFLLEVLNPAIRSAHQLERELGLRPVVSIPVVRTRRETNRRRLKWIGLIVALLAILFTLLRNLGERILGALWLGFTGMHLGGRGNM